MYDGSSATFEMLKRPDTVMVLAIVDNQFVLLEESQPGADRAFYGLPGGRHDQPGQTELEAAQREMAEETGYIFSKWKLLDVVQPHQKIEQFAYLFLAYDVVERREPVLDSGEKITVLKKSLREMQELCGHPRVRHLPVEVLQSAHSTEDIINLPEFTANSLD